MTAPATLLHIEDVRPVVAEILAPVADADPYVHTDVVDSLTPPALVLGWDDPWLEPGVGLATMGPCLWTARLEVACIAGRLEPGPGIDVLETLVSYVIRHLQADVYRWPLERVSAPLQRDLGGVTYLACNVVYAVPTAI